MYMAIGKFTLVMVRSQYLRFCIPPPRSRSVLILTPYSVPVHEQLLTIKLFTPPWVKLPIDTPCPVPNVQLETVMSVAGELPPISRSSSPVLIEQFRIRTLVEVISAPSVLCESNGVLIVMPWIV